VRAETPAGPKALCRAYIGDHPSTPRPEDVEARQYPAAMQPVRRHEVFRMLHRAFADSKTLTAEKRDALLADIRADPLMGTVVDSLSAAEISAKMLQGYVTSTSRLGSVELCQRIAVDVIGTLYGLKLLEQAAVIMILVSKSCLSPGSALLGATSVCYYVLVLVNVRRS